MQALDLTPYYKEGDGVVIVASVPKSENSAAVQDTDDTEADSEASAAGESGQRLMPVLPVPAELRIYTIYKAYLVALGSHSNAFG